MARVRVNAVGWTALLATVPLWWGAYRLTLTAWRTWPAESAGAIAARSTPPVPHVAPPKTHVFQCAELRDPFQRVSPVAAPRAIASQFAFEELRVVAINQVPGCVLVIDPRGGESIVRVGDSLGKAETVGDATLFWRVDRIRSGDVVFVREDPSRPEIQPTSRILSLLD